MSDTATQRSRAQAEAADWFARQCRLSITTDELYAFRDWRRDPANAAAFAAVEATWIEAGGLIHDPDIRAATEEALRTHPSRRTSAEAATRSRWLLGLATAGAIVVIGGVLVFQPAPTYETQVGQQRLITLQDGSRVRLNTNSKLVVRYRRDERRVVLARGEAFFEAAHNADRPFVVEADGTRVRAIGTKFDVRRDADLVRVTLLEGRVQVAKLDQPPSATLTPNQQLTVTPKGMSPIRSTDAAEASGWTSGRLIFHQTPLEDAVAEVNRYSSDKLVLEVPVALARTPVSGAFNTGDTQGFVSAVEGGYDLQSSSDADGSVHLRPRAAQPAS